MGHRRGSPDPKSLVASLSWIGQVLTVPQGKGLAMARDFQLDEGHNHRAAGLIVLATDETLEPEIAPLYARAGQTLYHARLPSAPEVTRETLARMEADLPTAAALLPSGLAAIGYGCTSGATVIGPARVEQIVRRLHPQTKVTNPLTALLAACKALNVRRLGFLTPYVAEVSAALRQKLEAEGLVIAGFDSFGQGEERTVARIREADVLSGLCTLGAGDCDAVFAACTNLRSFNILDAAESAIGKPVLSSNLVLAWHLALLAEAPPLSGPGRLLKTR